MVVSMNKKRMFNLLKKPYMKKVILACAAALFCIGSIAQVQDSVNNNLRQGAQETQEEIKEESNEAGNELREGAERTGDEIQQGAERTGEQIEQGADDVKQGAEQTGNEIKEETQDAGNQLREGADRTENEIQQGAERTGEQIEQGADDAKDQMDPSSQAAPSPNATDMGATGQPPMQEIEVLEDKEGPDNQVVYKYQGEFYYVDREQKQLVKIDESQLKDAEHSAIEHNATMSGNEQDKQ
jgi:gas vesicle protein